MATRSVIGIVTPNREVRYISCFLNGFPEWNGRVLHYQWTQRADVEALMELGCLSQLGSDLDDCEAYIRDWGQEPRDFNTTMTADGIEGFWMDAKDVRDIAWAYLFTDNGWLVAHLREKGKPFSDSDDGVTPFQPLGEMLADLVDPPPPGWKAVNGDTVKAIWGR